MGGASALCSGGLAWACWQVDAAPVKAESYISLWLVLDWFEMTRDSELLFLSQAVIPGNDFTARVPKSLGS